MLFIQHTYLAYKNETLTTKRQFSENIFPYSKHFLQIVDNAIILSQKETLVAALNPAQSQTENGAKVKLDLCGRLGNCVAGEAFARDVVLCKVQN